LRWQSRLWQGGRRLPPMTHRVISLPCNNQVASGQSRHFVAGKTAWLDRE
jgi:hypothetical protein